MYRFHEQADGRTHRVAAVFCRLLQRMLNEAGQASDTRTDSPWQVMTFGAAISRLCAARPADDCIGFRYGLRLAHEPDVIDTIDGAPWRTRLELLALLKRFHPITGITFSTRLRCEKDTCLLDIDLPYCQVPAEVSRFSLQACLGFVGMTLIRCGLPAEGLVAFDSHALAGITTLPARWAPPRLDSVQHCRIQLSLEALQQQRSSASAHPQVIRLRQLLPRVVARSPLVVQVEQALGSSPEVPDAATICRRLHISRATLHRALRASGTHFQQLVEEEKLQRALYWITVQGATVEETATRMGYSDASNFRRAFKKWTGHTPSALRSGQPVTVI